MLQHCQTTALRDLSVSQPLATGRKVNLGWISRPRTKYNSRAVVNEGELLEHLRAHYGASMDLRVLYFNGSLTQAMQDVSQLDVLVGVHGAGAACLPLFLLLPGCFGYCEVIACLGRCPSRERRPALLV